MKLVRARVLHDRVVEYTLSDGRKIQRDFSLVRGGVFNSKKWTDPKNFAKARVKAGEPSWPGELDFCSDVILRGGLKGRVPAFAFVGNGPNGGRLLSRKAGEAALEELWNEVNIPIAEKRLTEIDAGRRKAIPLDEVFARIERADQDQNRLVDQSGVSQNTMTQPHTLESPILRVDVHSDNPQALRTVRTHESVSQRDPHVRRRHSQR